MLTGIQNADTQTNCCIVSMAAANEYSFLLEYSSNYLNNYTKVLVNTGSTLTQAANDEKRVYLGPKGSEPSTSVLFNIAFDEAFTSVRIVLANELHVDLMINHMLSY